MYLIKAGSRSCFLLVAAMTTTFFSCSNPSICTRRALIYQVHQENCLILLLSIEIDSLQRVGLYDMSFSKKIPSTRKTEKYEHAKSNPRITLSAKRADSRLLVTPSNHCRSTGYLTIGIYEKPEQFLVQNSTTSMQSSRVTTGGFKGKKTAILKNCEKWVLSASISFL